MSRNFFLFLLIVFFIFTAAQCLAINIYIVSDECNYLKNNSTSLVKKNNVSSNQINLCNYVDIESNNSLLFISADFDLNSDDKSINIYQDIIKYGIQNIYLFNATIRDVFESEESIKDEIKEKNQSFVLVNILQNMIAKNIGGSSDLPTLLAGLVVAYLTILISVAVAIFSEKKEFETLDRNVILDYIVKSKILLFYLGLTFIPLLFWNGSTIHFRLLEIFLWFIGMIYLTGILYKSYHWMKGNKFQQRFFYLKKIQNIHDIEEAWRSVWQTESINYQNEIKFFDIFYVTVNKLLHCEKKNILFATKMLEDFDNCVEKRSPGFFTLPDKPLVIFLNWHFEMWQRGQEFQYQDDSIESWGIYDQIFRTIESIFQKIIIIVLKGRHAYLFFKTLKEHTENNKVTVSNNLYVEFIFRSFYEFFFENIHSSTDKFNIWNHYFPVEWKVTISNLQSSENQISQITLNNFLEWAVPKILEEIEEKDFSLDDVSRNIFPEVDSIIWASILIFVYSSYSDDRTQLRSAIERPWNFGFFSHVKVSSISKNDDIQNSLTTDVFNTVALAFFIFPRQFSYENLVKYLDSLQEISYPEGSNEESKRLRLYNLFIKMLAQAVDRIMP